MKPEKVFKKLSKFMEKYKSHFLIVETTDNEIGPVEKSLTGVSSIKLTHVYFYEGRLFYLDEYESLMDYALKLKAKGRTLSEKTITKYRTEIEKEVKRVFAPVVELY